MGNDISCPCTRVDLENQTEGDQVDILSKVLSGQLNQKDIILDFFNEQTKVCLIKTENIEQFFNNRKLLKIPNNKDYTKYYNSVFISNYLAKNDLTLVVLLDSPFKPIQNLGKNNFVNTGFDNSGKYSIEFLNLVASTPDQVIKQINHNFSINLKKNMRFLGIINDSPKNRRQFHILYKLHYSNQESNVEYSIQIYKGELDEGMITEVLKMGCNKLKKLRAIMIDFTVYGEEDSICTINVYKTKDNISKIKRGSVDIYRQCKRAS